MAKIVPDLKHDTPSSHLLSIGLPLGGSSYITQEGFMQ